MPGVRVLVTDSDMVTPYGWGEECCWSGLMGGRTAISKLMRFDTRRFTSPNAGIVSGLNVSSGDSLIMQMAGPLLARTRAVPSDAPILLATTAGEIDLLERSVFGRTQNAGQSVSENLLGRLQTVTGSREKGMVISAACASSTCAVAHAAELIAAGSHSAVCVIGCDAVTEFVFAGFSALMALDPDRARPFAEGRKGLSLGEGVAMMVLMSEQRAAREKRTAKAEISGWGLSNDANHMTGPSRDGAGLIQAIRRSLAVAGLGAVDIASVSAHGTGTVYNDSMEIKALKSVFDQGPVPTYSIKGGTGHTLGATGLVELIIAVKSLREGIVPPTVGLGGADDEFAGWVAGAPVKTPRARATLSMNSGFGGVNAAIVVSKVG